MRFGLQFFPDVRPDQKSGADYFRDALSLAEEADELGFSHIRIVEHYFHYYGGYSPNPMLFLAAAAQRTRRARLVTGAVLPVFNHPLKLAGEIGMLDAISATPEDETARGSVTVIELAPPHDNNDLFQTIAMVERDADGAMRWLAPHPTVKILIYTDLSGRLRTAIDLRGTDQ